MFKRLKQNGHESELSTLLKNKVLEKQAEQIMDPVNPSDSAKFSKDGIVTFKAGNNFAQLPSSITTTNLQDAFFYYLAKKEFDKNDVKNKFNAFNNLMPNVISGQNFKITPAQLYDFRKLLYVDPAHLDLV